TLTLSLTEAIYLTETAAIERLGRPQTTRDLAFLFNLGRTLSTAVSQEEWIRMLTQKLQEVFEPAGIWLALRDSRSGDLEFTARHTSPRYGKANDIPKALLESAIKDNRGIMAPISANAESGTHSTLMIAPLSVSGEPIGAV